MSETLEIPANTWEIKESEKQERSDTSSTNLEQQSQQEISSLTQETKDKLWKLTQEIITKIDQDPDFYKKDNAFLITIGEKLKNKEYFQAFFALLQGLIKGFSLSSKSGFKHLESELQKLNLPEKSLDELQELIGQFEKEIKNQNWSLSDLTDKTFLLSQCKDKAMEKHCAEKHLAEPTPYDKLRYHIFTPTENAVGKVLLFNVWANGKGESGF